MLMGCFGSFGASAPAHTVSAIQSGVNIVVYQATCPYPSFHWIQIWDGKCFLKSSLLEQGFVMHLGHNGQSCPVQRNPLDDASMAGADEEEEQEEDLPENVSQIMGHQDTLVIAHSNGVFH